MANELEIPGGVKPTNNVETDAWAGPYASVAAARAAVPVAMRLYRTVKVIESGSVVEYVWKSGTTDGDLVLKNPLTYTAENVANKGVAGGYAELDGAGKVPAAQLPGFVDDVLEYANFAAFPGAGETGKIYIALDTNNTYRWSGSAYASLSNPVSSATESAEGVTRYGTQSEVEAAADAAVITDIPLNRSAHLRGLRWFINRIFATTRSISGAWSFLNTLVARQFSSPVITLTDASTIAWDGALGQNAEVTLNANRTLGAISNPANGTVYTLRVIQDANGLRTLAFNAAYLFPSTPELARGAGAYTVFRFQYNGTNFVYLASNVSLTGVSRATTAAAGTNTTQIATTEFATTADNLKVNLGANSTLETLADASDDYGPALLSRLGAIFKTTFIRWNETLKQFWIKGSSSIIEVDGDTLSGNAIIRFLTYATGNAIGFIFQDSSLNQYLLFRSSTDGSVGRAVVLRQNVEYDFGKGYKRITFQFSLITPDATANTQYVLFEFTLADGDHMLIRVSDADAASTDDVSISSLGIDVADVRKLTGSNIEGNTSNATQSRLGTITTGGFNWNLDTVNQKIQYRFQNSNVGKTYEIFGEASYIKRIKPTS